jgi:cell division septation protein DedD
LIDAESSSELPPRAACPRCDEPFRAALTGFESAAVAGDAPPVTPRAFITARETGTHINAPRAFTADLPRARTRDGGGDVPAPARVQALYYPREDAAGVMLYIDGGLFASEMRGRPRAAADKYSLAVRLMNVSPLWLFAACAGFFALVLVFDLLLTPARRAGGAATALASLNNQATNRDTARRAGWTDDDQPREQAARETVREVGEARTGSIGGSSAEADAQAGRSESKPAPVSDAPADLLDTSARAAGASYANASGGLPRADAGGEPAGGAPQALRFTIQLGSFRVAPEAEEQAETLRAAGFDARVVVQQNGKRPWHCVQTGLFAARGDAERHLAELRAKGFAASYTMKEIR